MSPRGGPKSGKMSPLTLHRGSVVSVQSPLPGYSPGVSSDTVAKLNKQLIQVLEYVNHKEELNKKLQFDVEKQRQTFGIVKHQMGILYDQFDQKKKEWEKEKNVANDEKIKLEENLESLKIKNDEYEAHLNAINNGNNVEIRVFQLHTRRFFAGPDETLQKMADTSRKIAILKSNEAIMIRRYKLVEESEKAQRKNCDRLRQEMVAQENAVIEKMGMLQR